MVPPAPPPWSTLLPALPPWTILTAALPPWTSVSAALPPWPALLAALVAALLAGLARGFSGFGSALIFIPLASAALGPRIAAPLLMLVDNATTLPLLPAAWRIAARRQVALLAAGALVGTPLGALVLLRLDATTLRWGMCAMVVAMLALLASGWRFHGKPRAPLSIGVGALSGFCAGAAQMAGPPVIAYWLGGAIPAAQVRGNIVLFFAISGLIGGITYLVGGLLNAELLLLTAVLAPVYGAGVWGGSRLFGLASEAQFRKACFLMIALAAVLGLPVWDQPGRN